MSKVIVSADDALLAHFRRFPDRRLHRQPDIDIVEEIRRGARPETRDQLVPVDLRTLVMFSGCFDLFFVWVLRGEVFFCWRLCMYFSIVSFLKIVWPNYLIVCRIFLWRKLVILNILNESDLYVVDTIFCLVWIFFIEKNCKSCFLIKWK